MNYALITGASKGIGKEMALELASRKCNLVLVARSEDALDKLSTEIKTLHGVECSYVLADLTDQQGIDKVVQLIEEKKLPINILINNAGYGLWGSLEKTELSATKDMMQINMMTPVELSYRMIPIMKASGQQSYILNVASTAAYQAVPTLAVYSASKAFMVLFTRGLRLELKNENISVTCLSPGTTETNFMNAAGMTASPSIIKKASKVIMKADVVAKFAIDGMFAKKNEIIPGWLNKISVAMTYFVPKALTEKIAGDIYK
ncbi:MAG: SDR family oxidoreductase [Bacteroidetes bacterium]|nr:SDR family oxidoreductase [Bacteroidota bacterium]